MKAALILLLFALIAVALPSGALAEGWTPIERVRVVDGDTVDVDGVRIRLNGIDAPEWRQPGGEAATVALAAIIGAGDAIACRTLDVDRYGREIGACRVRGGRLAGTVDINEAMVVEGHAWAFVRYDARYAPSERAARIAGVGLWGTGNAVAPWDWRAARRARHAAANDNAPTFVTDETAASDCAVKVSRAGIAHDKTSPWYGRLKRFACFSDIEAALGAGARKPAI